MGIPALYFFGNETQKTEHLLPSVEGKRVIAFANTEPTAVPDLKPFRLKKIPWKMSHIAVLNFKDVEVPKDNRVGEPQCGFYYTMKVFNNSRIGILALSFSTALGAFKLAYQHATSRKAFGKHLIEHDSEKNEFAAHVARLEACWLLVQKADYLNDTNQEYRYNSSMAKLVSTGEALNNSLWCRRKLLLLGLRRN